MKHLKYFGMGIALMIAVFIISAIVIGLLEYLTIVLLLFCIYSFGRMLYEDTFENKND